MSTLKLEPFSGIAGDMFVAALAQLADAEAEISQLPQKLNLADVDVEWKDSEKCSILCRKVDFIDNKESHEHVHRHLRHLNEIADNGDLNENTKVIAKAMFKMVAEAEAEVHGTTIEKVHFHEVGAIDSIMDMVAAAFLIDKLKITNTVSLPICTGKGFVMTQHGKLPVPAPATEKLLQGMPCYAGNTESELVTPTGAAILRYLNPRFEDSPINVQATAYGAGTKDFEHPNALRASVGQLDSEKEFLYLVQTNIDDMPAEYLGDDLIHGLLEKGALDAFTTPCRMKKGRNGILLEALCQPELKELIENHIFAETSTIGIRSIEVQRTALQREEVNLKTPYGSIKGKKVVLPNGNERISPEYISCLKRSQESKVTAYTIYKAALGASV